jgi:hypothetical protein
MIKFYTPRFAATTVKRLLRTLRGFAKGLMANLIIDSADRPVAKGGELATNALRRDQVIGTPLAKDVRRALTTRGQKMRRSQFDAFCRFKSLPDGQNRE